MKKKIVLLLMILSAVIFLNSCSLCESQSYSPPESTSKTVETTMNIPPSTTQPATVQSTAATYEITDAVASTYQTTVSVSTSYSYIGAKAAKDIALKASGLSENDVVFVEVGIDSDDGTRYYNVEFHYGIISYEYEIDAISGRILEADKEVFD